LFPFRGKINADGGYQGGKFQAAVKRVINQINVKIVKHSNTVKGFLVLPKRWVVERTLASLNRCRRLAKDWECPIRRTRLFASRLRQANCARAMQEHEMVPNRLSG
jgi:transposase